MQREACRVASHRVASRCIASDRIAAMRCGISKMATFVHPRLHARGHFCSAPLDFTSSPVAAGGRGSGEVEREGRGWGGAAEREGTPGGGEERCAPSRARV